jgi:hypothetical protein
MTAKRYTTFTMKMNAADVELFSAVEASTGLNKAAIIRLALRDLLVKREGNLLRAALGAPDGAPA